MTWPSTSLERCEFDLDLSEPSAAPLSKVALRKLIAVPGGNEAKLAAIDQLLEADPPGLVYVASTQSGHGLKKPRGGAWPVWHPARVAADPRFQIVPKAVLDA